ncbi:MAG: Bax inhibitor-1/YccA family protein [Emcibacteraceae bacterium]|nr:Bax inhibitor-1/YccA family protein [Emcibacteraceae bacterium]
MVDRNSYYSASSKKSAAEIDEGLRAYMLTVYNYMASALALTGLAAYVTANTPAVLSMLYGPMGAPTGLGYIVMFSPLAFILALNFGINKMKASTLQMVFWAFAGVMGLSLSNILLMYTGASVAKTFFVTAAAFGSLSLYGYTTKKNLTGMGSFLIMGLFGLIIASIVNMFMQSSMMEFVISVIGVLIFAGLTAYDTQRIKLMYMENDHSETASKKAIMGALSLYLDFINMFLFLLRLMGNRE